MDRIAQCYMGYPLSVGLCACRDEASATDAVQDALVQATERLSQFRGDGSAKAWLSRMVVNACHCQARGRKNNSAWNQPFDDSLAATNSDETAAQHVGRKEFQAHISSALDSLSAEDRELFLLSQLHDTTGPELASLYEKSPEAIRARLTRMRRKLRVQLAETWDLWRSS
jgi:RNA polymerase sigma factor (sigma-70 family)